MTVNRLRLRRLSGGNTQQSDNIIFKESYEFRKYRISTALMLLDYVQKNKVDDYCSSRVYRGRYRVRTNLVFVCNSKIVWAFYVTNCNKSTFTRFFFLL